jgi:hypothetical protein
MTTFQSALESRRFNTALMVLGAAVLAVGIVVFLVKIAGGSDHQSAAPSPDFHAKLPAKSTPMRNADGTTIKTYKQLDPRIRSTIRTFLATAVARKHLDQSWAVVAPSVKKGYTFEQWSHAKALPIIPYPIADVDKTTYYLDYAATNEILLEVGVSAPPSEKLRPTSFQLGLRPVGANKQWVVDYWMPRWTPPLPQN